MSVRFCDQGGVPFAAPPPLLGSAWQSIREPLSPDLPDTMKDPLPAFAIVARTVLVAVAASVHGSVLRSISGLETDAHPQAIRTIRTPGNRDRPADRLAAPPGVRSKRKPASN